MTWPVTNSFYNRRHISGYTRELSTAQYHPEERLRAIQLERVRRRLEYAATWVPFYQERFRTIGFDPHDIKSLEDLAALPTVSRDDVAEHNRDMVDRRLIESVRAADRRYADRTLGEPIPFGRYRRHRLIKDATSGSSGTPAVFYNDGSIAAVSWGFEGLFKGWYGGSPGGREVRTTGLSSAHKSGSQRRKLRLRQALWPQMVVPGLNLTEQDFARMLGWVNDFRPDVLWGYTSALRGLAAYISDGGGTLRHRPRLVVTRAEPMYPQDESIIRAGIGGAVTNLYSSMEVGHVSCGCPEGSSHINQPYQLVETVRQPGVAEGGRLVITPLFDAPMPVIRYDMGDVGDVASSSCPCGRTLQVLSALAGRAHELFITNDGRMIAPAAWTEVFDVDLAMAGFVKRYQIVYRSDGSVLVKAVKKEGASTATQPQLVGEIERNLGPGHPVEFRLVDRIEPQPSGKVPIVKWE